MNGRKFYPLIPGGIGEGLKGALSESATNQGPPGNLTGVTLSVTGRCDKTHRSSVAGKEPEDSLHAHEAFFACLPPQEEEEHGSVEERKQEGWRGRRTLRAA